MEVCLGGDGAPGADPLEGSAPESNIDTENLISDMKSSKIQIVTVVEKLGPLLTSTDIETRIKGVKIFNNVLVSLSVDFLSEVELNLIATFYADRLNDNHKVVPTVLEGILIIAKMKNLSNDMCRKILKAQFDNVPCQQQVRLDRYNIYTILHLFIVNHMDAVKAMGTDFNLGVVFSMDGERDPRNLSFLFSMLPGFLKSACFGHVAEEMFEVMACYFPVDFNTPQDDINTITRDGLAEKLAICLSANKDFAQFCIPLLMEKLDSSLKVAKLDSLNLLKLCCSTFTSDSFLTHLPLLWPMLFKEVSQESDIEVQLHAHSSLAELIGHLASDKTSSICEGFLKQIYTSVQSMLADAKTKSRYELCLKIYLTVASASDTSCIFVTDSIHSLLMTQFSLTSDDSIKAVIVNYFITVFAICKRLNVLSTCLSHFKFAFMMIEMATKSTQNDLRLSGFKCITVMAELISLTESLTLLEVLRLSIDHEQILTIADASKKGLLSMVKQHPSNFTAYIDELFVFNYDNVSILRRRLNVLCCLISVSDYTHVVIDRLMKVIFDSDKKVVSTIIEVLSDVLRTGELFGDEKLQEIQIKYNFINSIMRLVDNFFTEADENELKFSSKIIITFMRSQTNDEQLKLYEILIPKYLEQISNGKSVALVMLEALLNSSKQDLIIDKIGVVISGASNFALNQNARFVQEKSCMLIANLVNKYIMQEDVQTNYAQLKDILINNTKNDVNYLNSLMLMAWLTKALLLNGHSEASFWLRLMIEFLNTEKLGLDMAKHFKLIMMDSDEALNYNCFCKTNFLYRQKVFHIFLQSTQESDIKSQRESYFLALAYIIQFVPRSVLLMELSKISPILLECLNFNEPELLLAILDTFVFLIQNDKLPIGIQNIVTRCLRLSEKDNPIKIRVASLQCLFEIANFYPTVHLLHFKQDVILDLAKRLDDPKRLVRSVAVKARTRWFLVGSPGEDKEK